MRDERLLTLCPWLRRLRAFAQPLRGSGPRETLEEMQNNSAYSSDLQ
jgi:hypothetical protein